MSHIPVDHRLRPFYRFLAALAGIYVLTFGIIAFTKTRGTPFFSQHAVDHAWVLGLRTNFGFAVMSLVAGAIVLVAAVIGRNLDRVVNIYGGLLFMVAGMASLAFLETNANYLAFSMSNCVASFIIGSVLFSAGLYAKTSTSRAIAAEPVRERATAGAAAGR